MSPFVAELLGTMLLIILGDGVVANVVLNKTKGQNGGWIVITAGWGVAVYVAAACVAPLTGAHLNPAVTIGLWGAGKLGWDAARGKDEESATARATALGRLERYLSVCPRGAEAGAARGLLEAARR